MLLACGFVASLLFESTGLLSEASSGERVAHAWFLSVTSRTAGFNTVPTGLLSESTKFLVVMLMFVGASPGSTGGGIKTASLAVTMLTLRAVIRGRGRVEVFNRTLPEQTVYRGLLIVALGALSVVAFTLVLVAIESNPGHFLDYLFETTSALATVGLSTGVTFQLSPAGRLLIVLAMFVGRVGPLTAILALTEQPAPQNYRYPEERVVLG